MTSGIGQKNRNLHLQTSAPRSKLFPSAKVYSPVTDLTLNLGELSTSNLSGYEGDTPKRSMASTRIRTPLQPLVLAKQLSNNGSFLDSPMGGVASPGFKERSPFEIKSSAFRRFQAMPGPFCGFDASPCMPKCPDLDKENSPDKFSNRPRPVFTFESPENSPSSFLKSPPSCAAKKSSQKASKVLFSFDDEDSSQDSGVGLEKDSMKDDLHFLKPIAPAPRRLHSLEESNSPHKYSPIKDDIFACSRPISAPGSLFFSNSPLALDKESPVKLQESSLTSSLEDDDGDDGFLDLVDIEAEKLDLVPKGLEKLFSRPVLSSTVAKKENGGQERRKLQGRLASPRSALGDATNKPALGCSRRGLFRSHSEANMSESPCLPARPFSFKRMSPCRELDTTPVQNKRRKSIVENNSCEKKTKPTLQRCHSEAAIKSALEREDGEKHLIGDFTKPYCLPMIPGKHNDLKSISPATLAAVLKGEYDDVIEKYTIIDSRYPYEFEGGHIRGAQNIYQKGACLEAFLQSNEYKKSADSNKRNILIFHCEFSSERGPSMSRFLRNKDRDSNKDCYPTLIYPEVYLLHNGYKAFFEDHKELCVPEAYKPMLHEAHSDDLKHFRIKSKSWAGERITKGGNRIPMRRGLKSLSAI